MSDSKKEIGERLRSSREKKGFKQVRVAKSLGVHSTTITKYESGEREPDAETLKKLADIYEVSVGYLLTGTQQKQSPQQSQFNPKTIAFLEDFETLPDDDRKTIENLLLFLKNKKSLP